MSRAALLFVIVLYVPFVLGLAAGLGWVGYWLTQIVFTHAFSFRGLAILLVLSYDLVALVLMVLLLIGLLPLILRHEAETLGGEVLQPQHHPKLFGLLDRICKRLQCRPPEHVILHPTEETSIGDVDLRAEDGTRRRAQRVLYLGAGLIVNLRADEYATILCHEIAHAATGDTAFSRFTRRFFRAQQAALCVTSYDDESPWVQRLIHWLLIGYYLLYLLAYAADARRRERRADRMAAEICGPQNIRNALIKSYLASYIPDLTMEAMFKEFAQREHPTENIYGEYRRRWATLPEPRRVEAENRMFMETPSLLATHPVLAQRIKALSDVQAREWTFAQPATALFGDWPKLEARMTSLLLPGLRKAYEEYWEQAVRAAQRGR